MPRRTAFAAELTTSIQRLNNAYEAANKKNDYKSAAKIEAERIKLLVRQEEEKRIARGADARAKLTELKAAQASGKFIPRREAEQLATEFTAALYNRFVTSVPARIAGDLIGKTRPEILEILQKAYAEEFENVRSGNRLVRGGGDSRDS